MAGEGEHDQEDQFVITAIGQKELYEDVVEIQGVSGVAQDKISRSELIAQNQQIDLSLLNLIFKTITNQPKPIHIKNLPPPQNVKIHSHPLTRPVNQNHQVITLHQT